MSAERKYSREDFYKEEGNFQAHGRYVNPGTVTGYISSIEAEEPVRARRLYEQVVSDNLSSAKPDYEVVDESIAHLRKLGQEGAKKAEELQRTKESKLAAATDVAMMRVGWNTMVRRRVKEDIRSGAAKVVLVGSAALLMIRSVAQITGNVVGTARTSASWGIIFALVALLAAMFLVLYREKKE